MKDKWYCQWCERWHVGETNCKGYDRSEHAMFNEGQMKAAEELRKVMEKYD